jgi:hypothetical protein
VIGLSWLSVAQAHEPGLSYGTVGHGELTQTFSATEMAELGPASELGLLLEGFAFARTTVSVDGQPCSTGPSTVRPVAQDGVRIRAELDCPDGAEWTYGTDFLADLDPGHRHAVEAFGAPVAVLSDDHDAVSFAPGVTGSQVALDYLELGVEHIWTGFDHLTFLLALVLVATGLRQMLAIVTGFTLAHTMTLTLAVLGVLSPPAALIEPAIALTIAYAGFENLWRPGPRRRFVVTTALGLVHGFGFAGLLLELGLPREHLITALLCFNGGVELGQAVVVALVLPVLLWAHRWPAWQRWGVPALSVLIGLAGIGWFLARVLG